MTVVPPWNFFSKPAHLFLHVLRFERLRRFEAAAIVAVVQLNYRPSIDGSGRRFWPVLVDFEGVHSRPSYLGRFANIPSSPRPLSADRDAPSKHHELFGAADDMYQRSTALSGAEEETADIATIPKLEGCVA